MLARPLFVEAVHELMPVSYLEAPVEAIDIVAPTRDGHLRHPDFLVVGEPKRVIDAFHELELAVRER